VLTESENQSLPVWARSVRPLAEDSSQEQALAEIAQRVRWLSTTMVHVANTDRPNESGVKIGGHQASSASLVEVMVALWFSELNSEDYVSVKPHASPVLHSINYLLGDLDEQYLGRLRERGGLQSYPSRTKDPDRVDFSTGSVGIGATATIWAALAHRYVNDHFPASRPTRRFVALLGDAELDEGAVWEAVADSSVAKLGELLWIVDLNRQSLDRIIPDVQIHRLQGMFQAAGWQVLICKWGRRISELFLRPGGVEFRERMEQMPNEEFQRLLRSEPEELAGRILGPNPGPALAMLIGSLPANELALAVRDLGGHDIKLLLETFQQIDPTRPTVLFAYTVKGRGLPTEGHPNNHAARLTTDQMLQLSEATGENLDQPWSKLSPGSLAGDLVAQSRAKLAKAPVQLAPKFIVPVELPWEPKSQTSTQAVLGRVLLDLQRSDPELASRIVTASPDVASSTNLGGWINKTGVWAVKDRTDWFADDKERLLKWTEDEHGQHIELGIAEGNLVGLLGELGATWSRWGEPLIPIGTLYDPFVSRALEPWSFGVYAGGQSILVGTPSGVTLAPEGGAHQSISTPSIGLEQPGVVAWEPAFAKDFEWCLLESMRQLGHPEGNSIYFRLSTRPISQELAELPAEPELRELRRQQAISGGYRLPARSANPEQITLVGVGAMMPEVIAARDRLLELGVVAAVVCLTSPDLIFRAVTARASDKPAATGIIDTLFPKQNPTPIVTVIDGHPHTLSFLSGIRGDRSINLGVTEFGQSSSLEDAYDIHGIDTKSIVAAALRLTQN
jgi:pyruvate dehydrogenase E1 component